MCLNFALSFGQQASRRSAEQASRKSTDSKSTDSKSADSKSTDSKSTDSKSTGSKSTDSKSTDSTVEDGEPTVEVDEVPLGRTLDGGNYPDPQCTSLVSVQLICIECTMLVRLSVVLCTSLFDGVSRETHVWSPSGNIILERLGDWLQAQRITGVTRGTVALV